MKMYFERSTIVKPLNLDGKEHSIVSNYASGIKFRFQRASAGSRDGLYVRLDATAIKFFIECGHIYDLPATWKELHNLINRYKWHWVTSGYVMLEGGSWRIEEDGSKAI